MHAIQSLQLNGYRYEYIEKHRTKTANSSQWTIPFNEEGRIFCDCVNKHYCENKNGKTEGYNLTKYKKGYKVIGLNCKGDKVKISKFIICEKYAHGYPADHVNKHQDKPKEAILLEMKKNELVDDLIIRKILKGRAI